MVLLSCLAVSSYSHGREENKRYGWHGPISGQDCPPVSVFLQVRTVANQTIALETRFSLPLSRERGFQVTLLWCLLIRFSLTLQPNKEARTCPKRFFGEWVPIS